MPLLHRRPLPASGWRRWLPEGNALSGDLWDRRHRTIVAILALHAPALAAYGVLAGCSPPQIAIRTAPLLLTAAIAWWAPLARPWRAVTATLGLCAASTVLVHLTPAAGEAWFHFFVVTALASMYQHWLPLLAGLTFVVGHHVALTLASTTPVAIGSSPEVPILGVSGSPHSLWAWTALHAGALAATSAVHVVSWQLHERTALRDPLTGLASRQLVLDRLDQGLERYRRTGAPLNVLLVDLDGFKAVNDRWGHAAGDALLVAVARRLSTTVEGCEVVGRLGGDEFAVVLRCSHREAARLGARLLSELSRPVELGSLVANVGASVGLAAAENPWDGVRELLRRADLAMYEAKARGRARLVSYSPALRSPLSNSPLAAAQAAPLA